MLLKLYKNLIPLKLFKNIFIKKKISIDTVPVPFL